MTSAPQGDQDAKRPWWRRLLRALFLAIFWPLFIVGVLIASTIFHLDSAPARRELCDRVEPLMNDALQGEFSMRCVEISPDRIAVADFVARDAEGVVVLRVESAAVDISRTDLFMARLVVESVRVENPYANLEPNDATGDLRIAEAFYPVDPAPDDPNAKKPNIPRIVVHDVLLEGGRVDHISPELNARGIRLHAKGIVDDQIEVTIHDIDGELVNRRGQVIASIERLDGEAAFLEPGSETRVQLRIDGMGDDFIEGTAGMTWGEEIPDVFEGDLELHASPETFAAAGLPEVGEILQSPVSGHIIADGGLEGAFDVRADLSTEGGDLSVTAQLSEQFERIDAHVETGSLDLAQVLVPVEQGRFEGAIDAELHPPGDDGRRRVVVDGEHLVYEAPDGNTYQAPALHVAAYLGDDHVEILELDLPHVEGETGHLDVTGRVGFDGAVDVNVDAHIPDLGSEPNLAQLIDGPLDGAVTIDARVKLDPNANFEMDARGRVQGRNLRTPWLTARNVEVDGSVRGSLPAPLADVDVEVDGLVAGGTRIETADLRIQGGTTGGGPGRYTVRGEIDGALPQANAQSSVDLVASVDDAGVTVDGTAEVTGLWSTPITAELDQVRYDSRGLRAQGVRIRTGDGMSVAAGGFLDLNGRGSDARVELANVNLEAIADRFGLGHLELRGTASAEIAFRGSTQAPILDTAGRVEGFQIAGVGFEELRWDVNIEDDGPRSSVLAVQLAVESSGNGRAELNARGRVPARNPLRALPEAYWDATFTTQEFRVGLLPEVIEGLPAIDGRVDTRVVLDGTIQSPERLALEILGRDIAIPGFTTVGTKIEAQLQGDDLQLTASVLYPNEENLVDIEARVGDFEILEVATSDAPLAFLADPWSLEVHIPERQLSEFPEPLRFPTPMTASLRARFSGGGATSRARTAGWVGALDDIRGEVEGWARYDEAAQAGCAEGQPEMRLQVMLERGETEVRVIGEIGDEPRLLLEAFAQTPIAEWAQRPPEAIPEVTMALQTNNLPLGSVPYVCQFADGSLNLDLSGRRIFSDAPDVTLQALVDRFSMGGSEPLRFRLEGGLDATGAHLEALMRDRDRVALRIEGRAPMRWGGTDLIPVIRDDERWEANADFDRAPIAPLLSAVPILAEPNGSIDGRIRAYGIGAEVHANGRLAMSDVGFILRQPYLRIEELNGEVQLEDQVVRISDLRFSDRDGIARVDGRAVLSGWMPRSATLRVRTDDFPLRVEGVIYAYLDTDTEIAAEFNEERNRVTIAMDDTAIRLPMDIGRSLQPLAQHADVIYEDQPGFDPNVPVDVSPVEETGQRAFADETLIQVRSDPFWVRRDDFAVQVRPRLDVLIDPDGAHISGPVQIRRGFIAFMGKEFEFKRGEVRFTGGNRIDPRVDIQATHELGGGEVITAHITGQLLKPELDFTSSRDPGISNSEAIQLLVGGRAGATSETASQQAASFLTGMFAGVLSSVTRREIGEFVPIFGIQSEGGNTTLRVGFQADQIIPDALDDIILGAYVEGYVGGGTGGGSGGGPVSGGAVIEFILPRSLVWTNTYDVPTNWSTDLMWEP